MCCSLITVCLTNYSLVASEHQLMGNKGSGELVFFLTKTVMFMLKCEKESKRIHTNEKIKKNKIKCALP